MNALVHPTSQVAEPRSHDGQHLDRSEEWLDNWQTRYGDGADPIGLLFHTFADGSAEALFRTNEGRQEWDLSFFPEDNGVFLQMKLTTYEKLPGGFIVPQCLRFSSGIGFGFRRSVAHTPYLSELLMQTLGNANGTLTWARSERDWLPFPVPFTRYHTAAAELVFDDSLGEVDQGLIIRETAPRSKAPESYWRYVAPNADWDSWSAGLYWERAAYISNRHPADCVHVGLDFGPLETGQSRTIEGKVYWMEGTKDDLLAIWEDEWRQTS